MKEYIAKEDILYHLTNKYGDECLTSADFDRVLNDVSDFFSVTKADICRGFIEYVKFCDKTYMKPQIMREPEYYKGYKDAFNFFEQILSEMDIENSILAEMEQE